VGNLLLALSPKTLWLFGANIGSTCNLAGLHKGIFFGLLPWDYYLPSSDLDATTCSIRHFHFLGGGGQPADLPLILIAVVDDLLRIAGLVAIAFVIVGAIRYTTSQGNPDDTAKAQSTIINALIGVAVATVAVGIVSFLGSSLGK
jgi:Type IV secretion system pilin